MQRRKKQLLGLVGLALVAIVTAIACALPTPDASAQEASVPVKVRVSTEGEVTSINILSLKDKSTVVDKIFEVVIEYFNADTVEVVLTNKENGNTYTVPTDHCPSADWNGATCTLEFNLAETGLWVTRSRAAILGTGIDNPSGVNFMATAIAHNASTSATSDDHVEFMYRAAYLEFNNEYDGNGDPIVYAVLGADAKAIQITAGIGDKTVLPQPLTLTDGEDLGNGRYKFVLPFKDNKVTTGTYTVALTSWNDTNIDSESTLINSIATVSVPYKTGGGKPPVGPTDPDNPDEPDNPDQPGNPDEPEVPGTGVRLFGGMNISSADYIITGLVAFGMVTMFAVFLIVRRSKRQ